MARKLCEATNEKAKLNKNIPVKSPEYVRLENMSNRMNQMNKRISVMKQENQEIVGNIINMRKFQKQFKKFEKDFRRKISRLKDKSQDLLNKAVTAYEEKDEFMYKEKSFQDRRILDIRKTEINENALDLCIKKAEKNEAFAKVQEAERTDMRIAETSEMIEQGITGLEPTLENVQQLQSSISAAAGDEVPEKMESNFKVADDKIGMMFSYLDELLKSIHHLQGQIDDLKAENKNLIKNMSSADRKLRKEIKVNQDIENEKLEEADKATKVASVVKEMMNEVFDRVKSLYLMIYPDDAKSLEQKPIDDSNVHDYVDSIEKQLLDYLICLERIRMEEASKEEKPVVIQTEKDEETDEQDEEEDLNITQARIPSSEYELESLAELNGESNFLKFKAVKEVATAAQNEIQSDRSGDEDDKDVN